MDRQKLAYWLVITATLLTTTAQYFFKKGAEQLPALITNVPFIIALALYFSVAGLMMLALKYGELSRTFPLLATSFVWVALMSIFFLGESLSITNWIGILSIIIGTVMLK